MSIRVENSADIVRMHFRRLSPAERREVLEYLVTDLDLPSHDNDRINGEGTIESEPLAVSGSLLEWFEENARQAELASVLQQHLPDFESGALTDPRRRSLIEQHLSSLSPLVLYEMHQKIVRVATRPRLTPEAILERTWGTISGIDRETLREIIEDEDYCGY